MSYEKDVQNGERDREILNYHILSPGKNLG